MPLLGFGVYQNYTTKVSVLEAFQAGYRHIDTAQAYKNESGVGEAVRESGLKREEVFVTTKCINKTHGYDRTLKGVDESLRRFGLDYIDLFLIHDPLSGPELRLATWKALLDARNQGKIRSVGVSNYNIRHLKEIAAAGLEMPEVNQIELHPFCQQKAIVEFCRKQSIIVQAYSPLVRSKPGLIDRPEISGIAQKHNREHAQILIRWSLQKQLVPLPKSASSARISSNTNVYDFVLDDHDMASLDALDQGLPGAVTWASTLMESE
ncbi:Aldo keto reductase [Coniophora puteana RWD-64-598 SS2]|uniref:Aldo keto reductase n=1 Tax=Coniophora puteana (strain RWD-64-598) TaxID=741705 RepID=A0A5M3MVL7_CONPW|nr:Aldo keto reductase [Coniophora puteana RWD-64-598 SS2]EIW82631.1 Aldo keto reductase [Coniophora puteana RWD-64-598 SS2]